MVRSPSGKQSFWFGLLILISASGHANAQGKPGTGQEAKKIVFLDDFSKDSRKDYKTLGNDPIEWEKGAFTLPSATMLVKEIAAGASIDVTLDLKFAKLEKDGDFHQTDFVFRLTRTDEWAAVRWTARRKDASITGTVQVLKNSVEKGKAVNKEIRQFTLADGVRDGRWKVRFHYGVIEVSHEEKLIGRAYDRAWHFLVNLDGFYLLQRESSLTCKRIDFRALPSFPLDANQKKQITQMAQDAIEAAEKADKDQFAQALRLNLKALEVGKKTLGQDHPWLMDNTATVGMTYSRSGQSQKGLEYIDKALIIGRNSLGANHPHVAFHEETRARILMSLNFDFESALAAYIRCLETYESVYGPRHPRHAGLLTQIGACHRALGNKQAAWKTYVRAADLLHQAPNQRMGELADLYGQMMAMKYDEKDLATAREFGKKAARLRADIGNKLHLVEHLLTMGSEELKRGQQAEAKESYDAAIALINDVEGPAQVRALLYFYLADWHQSRKEEDKVLACYAKARELHQEAHGAISSGIVAAYNLEANYFLSRQKYPQARASQEKAFQVQFALADRTLPYLSEGESLKFMVETLRQRDFLIFLHERTEEKDPALAYRTVWSTRGMIQRAMNARRSFALEDDAGKKLFAELSDVRQSLARLSLKPTSLTPMTRDQQANNLTRRKDELERELGARSEAFRAHNPPPMGFEDLVQMLPDDVALVDFVPAPLWPGDTGAYGAFILRKRAGKPGYSIRFENLGSAAVIDNAVASFRFTLSRQEPGGLLEPAQELADPNDGREGTLRRQVWERLEPHLDGCKTVVIIPEAALCRMPWGALPGKKPGTFLIEDYALSTASNGQTLHALLSRKSGTGRRFLAVGGVDYDAVPATAKNPAAVGKKKPWPPLPGTLDEANAVSQAWRNGPGKQMPADSFLLLQGKKATESAFLLETEKANYVHLATHGFFAERSVRSILQRAPKENLVTLQPILESMRKLPGQNPMLLSGVALAGANIPGEGILLAEQLANCNLRHTELVVLSACETGLGEVGGGEGVFGLQRAFELAGARAVVSSFWKVEDKATQTLMIEFYRNLWEKKMTRLEALRQAQITMLRRYDPELGRLAPAPRPERLQPLYWAAFSLQGDWR